MKIDKHLGIYGLLIENNKILLIKKVGGPYDGQLDLPGGSLEFRERPINTLKREFIEETGLTVEDAELYDVDSVDTNWQDNGEEFVGHHIGVFYKINKYSNEIKNNVEITEINDDSLGASFYDIDKLKNNELSLITIMELKKLGYKIR